MSSQQGSPSKSPTYRKHSKHKKIKKKRQHESEPSSDDGDSRNKKRKHEKKQHSKHHEEVDGREKKVDDKMSSYEDGEYEDDYVRNRDHKRQEGRSSDSRNRDRHNRNYSRNYHDRDSRYDDERSYRERGSFRRSDDHYGDSRRKDYQGKDYERKEQRNRDREFQTRDSENQDIPDKKRDNREEKLDQDKELKEKDKTRTEERQNSKPAVELKKVVDLLTSRTGGAYIPPAKLKMMQAQITDKSSNEYQRIAWEALKKSIHGHINKVNTGNLATIVRELLKENLVRGCGLLCRSIIQAQAASPTFTKVYAALVAVINSRVSNIISLQKNAWSKFIFSTKKDILLV